MFTASAPGKGNGEALASSAISALQDVSGSFSRSLLVSCSWVPRAMLTPSLPDSVTNPMLSGHSRAPRQAACCSFFVLSDKHMLATIVHDVRSHACLYVSSISL